MTPAQRRVLEQAIKDGNEIILTGLHRTFPLPRADVIGRLILAGFLESKVPGDIMMDETWRVSKAGIAALQATKGEA